MNDWRRPCEHGQYDSHVAKPLGVPVGRRLLKYPPARSWPLCPGGSPVTTADLEGEKVWWCVVHNAQRSSQAGCWLTDGECQIVSGFLSLSPQEVET